MKCVANVLEVLSGKCTATVLIASVCMCDLCMSASHVIQLKLVDAGYRFLWPFVAVLVICMCVMIAFTVSLYVPLVVAKNMYK